LEIVTSPARRVELADARKDSGREIGGLVTTPVGTIHAVVRGEGPDVVLLHGVTDNSHTWHDLQSALAGSARVHAVDLPGHGLSDIPRNRCRHANAPRILAYPTPHASGDGWSSLVHGRSRRRRTQDASRAGARARAPAMPDFTFPCHSGCCESEAWAKSYLMAANRPMRRFFMSSVFAQGFAPHDDVVERYWRSWQINGRARYIRALLREFKSTETMPLLGSIRAPTWIVHGDEDQLVPLRVADELETRLPGVKLARLTGVGHSPHLERPNVMHDAVSAALMRSRGNVK
jgi:pimeloyl-ACP methyl ester carboxylesterase